MPRQKKHPNRVYQMIGEPGPGAIAVGYVRYSMELQDPASIATQKRRIMEFAEKKEWKIVRWYEEPEQSAKYEEIEQRPIFSQLLNEAGVHYQVVLCYMNNRWSRNVPVAYNSLTRLRRLRVWWATSDGLWDIDKVQQDGFDVAFAVDTQMNAAYVRQLSKRTIDGKEDRARDGYHNGWVSFGYLPPEYPKAPDGAPSTWRPPRMPVQPDPVNFPALVRIGELVALGWADAAIADELDDYISRTSRFGERPLTKDTIAAIRRSWFPREFAPGCGHGTIDTPSGELVEGRHQAAWPYELWQRMVEVKAAQYRRPRKEAVRRPHEFSRIIVCAACRRPLRVTALGNDGVAYYKDTSLVRKLPCSAGGSLSVKSSAVLYQFEDLLRSVRLPPSWREAIAERYNSEAFQEDSVEHIRERRAELEAEQKRLVSAFTKGYIAEDDLDSQMERIRAELFTLPITIEQDAGEVMRARISAGETLEGMADYWAEAIPEERRDMIWSLLVAGGLIYDLECRAIVGLIPRPSVLPVLALGLEGSERWEQRGGDLWLREEHLPPKQVRENLHVAPPQVSSLTIHQQEDALDLVQKGVPIRQVARELGTSYESIRRLLKSRGVTQQRQADLTEAQQEEALRLVEQGMSLCAVAKEFGVSYKAVRQLVKSKGVVPTYHQPNLTPEQQHEALLLVRQGGLSLREVGAMFGVTHQTIRRIVRRLEREG